jgi:hypothetical protein
MKKKFALIIAIAFSVLFFACEEDSIPVPMPPSPFGQVEDDSIKRDETVDNIAGTSKAAAAPSEKPAAHAPAAKKEAKPAPKREAKPIPHDAVYSEQLSTGRYTIQIAVFPSEASAKALVKRMAGNGIKAYYAHVDNPAQLLGLYFRVRIGFFNERIDAEGFARTKLEPLGYAWWVDKRKNDNLGNAPSFGSHVAAPTDNELEAAKRAYKEQLAREAAEANQPAPTKKKATKK